MAQEVVVEARAVPVSEEERLASPPEPLIHINPAMPNAKRLVHVRRCIGSSRLVRLDHRPVECDPVSFSLDIT